MKPKTPEGLRALAAEYLAKAERASMIAHHAGDNAPGSFVTGRSGRSRAMDRKSSRAMDKTIKYSKIAVHWRERAASLEIQARYIENEPRRAALKAARKCEKRERIPMEERLFIGVYPTGWVFSDRGREVSGDYKRLGYMSFGKMELELEPDCNKVLAERIKEFAATMQAKRGEEYPTSACGQCVILGDGTLH